MGEQTKIHTCNDTVMRMERKITSYINKVKENNVKERKSWDRRSCVTETKALLEVENFEEFQLKLKKIIEHIKNRTDNEKGSILCYNSPKTFVWTSWRTALREEQPMKSSARENKEKFVLR